MITLKEPIATFWHPQGDKDGNPLKVSVDKAQISLVRQDAFSNQLEVAIMLGYIDQDGSFKAHVQPSGSIDYLSLILASDNDPKNPEAKSYSDFLASVAAKGAPHGDFRVKDIEQLILDKGIVEGTIDAGTTVAAKLNQ